jgi:predicted acetyltransferase
VDLRALRLEDEPEARAAHAELAAEGFAFLPFFEPGEPWAEYLRRVERLSCGDGLAPQYVPWTDLYGVVDGVVVGRVSVRHLLTEGLALVGGHIGYGVRKAYRRRGYATELLRAGLGVARDLGIDRALVTCDDDNVGSAAVIERCGGVLEDVRSVPGSSPKRRYWVPTMGDFFPHLRGRSAHS